MRVLKGGIAFFDSGIGGLTVLAECQKQQGDEIYYYYGDNHHAPYGNLPPKKIKRYVFRAFRLFKRLKVKAAVIACNTATAVCIKDLRRKFSFPIIGAEPAVCKAADKGGKVLVLATRATCESERFHALCERAKKLFPSAEISVRPCDGLAGVIERNIARRDFDYTPYLPNEKTDAVVLGCTHYIYIVEQIANFYGCPIFDGNEGIARRLACVLQEIRVGNRETCPPMPTDRDNRPLDTQIDHKVGTLTTKSRKKDYCHILSNKRSRKIVQKHPKNQKIRGVIFLGKQRENNKKCHEQMFIWL